MIGDDHALDSPTDDRGGHFAYNAGVPPGVISVREASIAYLYLFGVDTADLSLTDPQTDTYLRPLLLRPDQAQPSRQYVQAGQEQKLRCDRRDLELFLEPFLDSFRRYELRVPEVGPEVTLPLSEHVVAHGLPRAYLTVFRTGILCLNLVFPFSQIDRLAAPHPVFNGFVIPDNLGEAELFTLLGCGDFARPESQSIPWEGRYQGPVFNLARQILCALERDIRELFSAFAPSGTNSNSFLRVLLGRPLPGGEDGIHGQLLYLSHCELPIDLAQEGASIAGLLDYAGGEIAGLMTRNTRWRDQTVSRIREALDVGVSVDHHFERVWHDVVLGIPAGKAQIAQAHSDLVDFGTDPALLKALEHSLHQGGLLSWSSEVVTQAEAVLDSSRLRDQRAALSQEPLEGGQSKKEDLRRSAQRKLAQCFAALGRWPRDRLSGLRPGAASSRRANRKNVNDFERLLQPDEDDMDSPLHRLERELRDVLQLRTEFLTRIERSWAPEVFAYRQERRLVAAYYVQHSLRAGMARVRERLQNVAAIASEYYETAVNQRLEQLQRHTKLAQEIQMEITRTTNQSGVTLCVLLIFGIFSAVGALVQASVAIGQADMVANPVGLPKSLQLFLTSVPWVIGFGLLCLVIGGILLVVNAWAAARWSTSIRRLRAIGSNDELERELQRFLDRFGRGFMPGEAERLLALGKGIDDQIRKLDDLRSVLRQIHVPESTV